MSVLQQQLILCVASVIQLTSAQSTYDDVASCGRTEQVMTQLMSTVSQLMSTVSQLQKDFADLKADKHQKPVSGCPADFTYIESVKGCYKLVNYNLNWTAARLGCESLHGHTGKAAHLLVINDAAEQLAVAVMLASTETTLRACTTDVVYFWTAGQGGGPGGKFVWRVKSAGGDTESAMNYTNWYTGKPSNPHRSQNCLLLESKSYQWYDWDCYRPLCSVCEIEMTP